MASERVTKFLVLIKENKIFAIVFGFAIIALLIILIVLINQLIGVSKFANVPWCEIEKKSCGGQGYHIGCQPDTFPKNKACRNIKLIEMDGSLKRTILNAHNKIRNETASGFYEYNLVNQTHKLDFPKAARMREVVWDEQLQYLAELHAQKCTFDHDECRSTEQYTYVGQNIAFQASPRKNDDAAGVLKSLINDWYDERYTTNATIFDKFLDELNNHNGHFLVMVNEQVEKIGCAYIRYEVEEKKKKKNYGHQLTCNYSYTNMIGSAVFVAGEPKSDCGSVNSHGDSIFKNLCGPIMTDI